MTDPRTPAHIARTAIRRAYDLPDTVSVTPLYISVPVVATLEQVTDQLPVRKIYIGFGPDDWDDNHE
jgi:hypothetical protein